jgi:hypothetical protein
MRGMIYANFPLEAAMTTTSILPCERKFVKMARLMDKIVSNDLENMIDSMIKKDPRILCRLNLKNKQVSMILNKKINDGSVHPFDLMYEPEDTFSLVGASRTELAKEFHLAPEDESWFQSFENDFEEKTRKIKRVKIRRMDESHDDMMALV